LWRPESSVDAGAVSRRALLLAVLPLAACGFQPMYARSGARNTSAVATELSAVSVLNIPERPGQLLRESLRFKLGDASGEPKRYELSVGYGIGGEAIAILPDSAATRVRLSGTAVWSLRRQDVARSIVTSGAARSIDGFDLIDQQPFNGDLSNEAAQRRLAANLAEQITLQLASYFAAHPAPVAPVAPAAS
jgi:LPS-assembly lipoprotein